MEILSQKVGEKLLTKNKSISTIEHCTSGILGSVISSVCGLSSVYKGTIVTVDDKHFNKLLNIPIGTINDNGIVSSQVACQMALNGLYRFESDICVSIVGDIDCTNSVSNENNVVWICIAFKNDGKISFEYRKIYVFGLRGENIEDAINTTLDILNEKMDG